MKDVHTRVLVIYTGGTIGMARNENNVLAPMPRMFESVLRTDGLFHDRKYADEHMSAVGYEGFFALPKSCSRVRILYKFLENNPLLDSCDMTVEHWIQIARIIGSVYAQYDGFVVLHGTDTLVYTASALSFVLENLGKIVIVTGSQMPIYDSRSDGKNNLLCSLIMAGSCLIPEVTVFFENKLFRANRTVKISSNRFSAFTSPNYPPLAEAGVRITVDTKFVDSFRNVDGGSGTFHVHDRLHTRVALVRFYPTMTAEILESFLKRVDGVVLETYGSGNIPSQRSDLIDVLRAACERGVLVVNCTQCLQGNVDDLYESGYVLKQTGVIFGADMTAVAAFTKLCYVLSKDEWSVNEKRKMMQESLRGELTEVTNFEQVPYSSHIAVVDPTTPKTSVETSTLTAS